MKYEYKCPFCGYINVRYEERGRVICRVVCSNFTP
jgi:hypothetical protein